MASHVSPIRSDDCTRRLNRHARFALSLAVVFVALAGLLVPSPASSPLGRLAGVEADSGDPPWDTPVDSAALRRAGTLVPDGARFVLWAPDASPLLQGNLKAGAQLMLAPALPVQDPAAAQWVLSYRASPPLPPGVRASETVPLGRGIILDGWRDDRRRHDQRGPARGGFCVLVPALRGLRTLVWLSWAGVALLVGASLVGLGLLFGALLGAATDARSFAIVAVLVSTSGLATSVLVPRGALAVPLPPARPSAGPVADGVATVAAAALAVISCTLVVGGFRSSPWLDDAWGIWLPKGIALSYLGLDERLFVPNGVYVHFEVPDYPLWWSRSSASTSASPVTWTSVP